MDHGSVEASFHLLLLILQSNRKTWELELNISAPQIILVEHFCDKNAVIAVVDFGRFHLSTRENRVETQAPPPLITTTRDSEDEEGKVIS